MLAHSALPSDNSCPSPSIPIPLNPFFVPFAETEAIPFSRISEEDFLPAIRRGIALQQAEYDAIASCSEDPTIENTLLALEYSGTDLTRVLDVFYPLTSALSTDRLMSIDAEATPLLSDHSLALWQNEAIWRRIKSLYDRRGSLGLDRATERLLSDYYESFVAGGALLEGEERREFADLTRELSELTRLFGENVVKAMRDMTLTGTERGELAGIPANILSSVSYTSDGGWSLPISQPVYMEVMRSAQNRELRHRLYLLYGKRCTVAPYDNLSLIPSIAELRRRKAELLGFGTAAQMLVHRRMAATPERALSLLTRLRDTYLPALRKELEELAEFAGHSIEPWDYAYQALRLQAARYAFDEESMKPYLELRNVLRGVFRVAELLYGLKFEEVTADVDRYHPDVRCWRVSHPERGFLGLLYYDFFARPTKKPGAWMTEFRSQMRRRDGSDCRPYVTLVTNITAPTADEPILLRPREVETLLHETGHALHSLLSDCRYPGQAGTNVKRDFVELPSQMNEGFLYRPEFLSVAAIHHATGNPVPAELVDGLRRSARFGAAYQCFRQLGFGLLDMAWHSVTQPVTESPIVFERDAMETVRVFDEPDGVSTSAAFTHIFSGGYAAGYYSYKWAEVLAADAFEAIAPALDAPLDMEAAKSFERCILTRGDSEDPALLYREFRGREADPDALLRRDLPTNAS